MIIKYFKEFLSSRVYRNALILGDSHAKVFNYLVPLFNDYHFHINISSVEGATISGFSNPNSATNSLEIFNSAISEKNWDLYFLLIGEVDIGFIIWYRQIKYNISADVYFETVINNYKQFLDKFQENKNICCVSIPLPTISDVNSKGIVANQRSIIDVSQVIRTKKTLEFNLIIKKYCNEKGMNFIDLDKNSIGPDGLVSPILLNPDVTDHHYNPMVYSELLKPEIESILVNYYSKI